VSIGPTWGTPSPAAVVGLGLFHSVEKGLMASLCQTLCVNSIGGDLARSLGGRIKFRGLNFGMTFFRKKISILTPKISDDLF